MLYIIPFVILLVVAIILKKREDAKKETENPSDKTTVKKVKTANTKTTKSKVHASPTIVATTPTENKPKVSTPVPTAFKQKIAGLIQSQQYMAAEAQINQALKQDDSQHELYLLLIDLHVLQKDEFAINQLINHVRSLKLSNILQQAEVKKLQFIDNQSDEKISFVNNDHSTFITNDAPNPLSEAAFNSLRNTNESAKEVPIELTSIKEPESSTPPLSDNSQTESKNIQPLEFTPSISSVEANEANPELVETQTSAELAPLEFEWNSATPSSEKKPVENEIPVSSNTSNDVDFDFSQLELTNTETSSEQRSETLDFKIEQLDTIHTETKAPGLNFKLETPHVSNPIIEESSEQSKTASPLHFEAIEMSSQQIEVENTQDPLLQAFPELLQMDEIELNLELAEQYIELGAYDSARVLLNKHMVGLSADQQQRSEILLNRIAS